MSDKFTSLTPELHRYLLDCSWRPDDIERELIERTAALGPEAAMQTAPDQAALLAMLVRITGATRVVEVGTFTGLSALAIARALPENGRLLCCDVSHEWTDIAREFWKRAGVDHKIDLVIGPARETLAELPSGDLVDMSYIDADKSGYVDYYEHLLARTRPGGLVALDNVLWGGSVVDPHNNSRSTESIREINRHIRDDERVDVVILPIGDGLTIARKRQ
jgi:caffeoyl-CoA O-methyltransferase